MRQEDTALEKMLQTAQKVVTLQPFLKLFYIFTIPIEIFAIVCDILI